MAGTQKTIVDTVRYSGIGLQCLLLLFCLHNVNRYLYRSIDKKPLTLMIFYSFATITLIALILSLAVITNSTRPKLILEWTSITLAETGIQVIAIAQACSQLQLGIHLSAMKVSSVQVAAV